MSFQKVFSRGMLTGMILVTMVFAQRQYVGWSMGYHTTWGGQSPANMHFSSYTHICYFHGSISIPSTTASRTFTNACHANNTKAILSIGGWGTAAAFENASNTPTKRTTFVTNMVNGLINGGYDGLDIDWEEEGGGISSNYTLLIQELRTALNALNPRPLLVIATAQNQVNSAVAVKDYVDQMNLMSYWTLVGGMQSYVNTFTSRGIPKSLLGIGFGYDTDGEVDVDNPNDVAAKCLFAINNGYGGVMAWEIARACTRCEDTTAYYVNKTVTSVLGGANTDYRQQSQFTLAGNSGTGIGRDGPAIFSIQGRLVNTTRHGRWQAGANVISIGSDGVIRTLSPK